MTDAGFCEIARSWIGTPFISNARVKGPDGGVSCQMLASEIYKEAGILPQQIFIPEGPTEWGQTHKESLIEKFIDEHMNLYFVRVEERWPSPQDLIGFVIGGCVHHLGVSLGDTFVHAMANSRAYRFVTESRLDDATWLKRFARIWRPRSLIRMVQI